MDSWIVQSKYSGLSFDHSTAEKSKKSNDDSASHTTLHGNGTNKNRSRNHDEEQTDHQDNRQRKSLLLIQENLLLGESGGGRGRAAMIGEGVEDWSQLWRSLSLPVVMIISGSLHKEDQFQLERSSLLSSTSFLQT